MSFEVRTEFGNLDPEAKRALVAMQHAIKGHLDDVDRRARRPKRQVTEVVEEGGVFAKPGQVVRVKPSDTDVKVVLPTPDAGNGGEDIIVSFEGDGTATGKVLVTPANSTCANPGTTTLNTPGTYRFTSTGAPGENPFDNGSTWGGPAPLSLDDLPDIATGKVLGNNTGVTGAPIELTGSQVLDLVGSTRGSVLERGAAGWTAVTPGATELPIVSKGAGADPVYQQLATAGIADDAVTNAKLANMAQATIKLRASGAGTGDPTDGTITQALDMVGSTRGSLLERGAAAWQAITPGTSGLALCSQGAGADPAYAAIANAGLANMASPRLKGRTTSGTGAPEDLTPANSTTNTWNTATGGSISVERAALTGEVTATANANACTVTRSTDFQATPWTGNHQFNGEIRGGTITSTSASGALNITLTAGSTRLLLTSSSTITLGTISGCADGRLLFVEHTGTGRLTVTHDSASADAIACPNDLDFHLLGRGGFLLVGRLATNANWKMIEPEDSGRIIAVTAYTDTSPGSGTHTFSPRARSYLVRIKAGQGGGGGANSAAGQCAVGGQGGFGYDVTYYVTTVPTSVTYSVGGAGSGGNTSGGDGTDGTDASWDSISIVAAGKGGKGSAATLGSGSGTALAVTAGGAGGRTITGSTPTGGTLVMAVPGPAGEMGVVLSGTTGWGGGYNTTGTGGSGYGEGGFSTNNTDRAGGSGAIARITVWEFS